MMLVMSFCNSATWPLMGLLLSNMMFGLIGLTYDPEAYIGPMKASLGHFGLFCIGMGLFKGIE